MRYLRAPSALTKACRLKTDHTPHSLGAGGKGVEGLMRRRAGAGQVGCGAPIPSLC